MKHFAKSLVSIVMALSILATMCIVGVSVSAADAVDTNPNGVTMVSANLQKNAADAVAVGGTTVTVAATSTLTGGTAGVPATDAYVVSGTKGGAGVKLPIENSDWAAAAAQNDATHALKGYGINMWIYVSDATKVSAPIMRFFEETADGTDLFTKGAGNWTYQVSVVSAIAPKPTFQTGWNNVTFWFPTNGDYDHRAAIKSVGGQDGAKMASFQIWDYDAANTYTMAIACARLVKSADEAAGSWVPAPVVYPTDKEYLVYGLDREEGVTIGDWQDVTYDGGKGAFKTTTSNRVKKYLPESVDLTGKTVTAWIYVPEGATPGGQFELCTVDQDNGEFTFDSNTFGLKAGWNKVILDPNNKKDTAGVAEGAVGYRANDASANVANINVVRYYDANADFMLGAVYVTPEETVEDTREYLISAKDGEEVVQGTLESADYLATGNGAYVSAGVGPRVRKVLSEAVDASKSTVTVWLYVEDPSKVAIMDIELCSDGGPDGAETNFRFGPNDLKKGWNKYILDATKAKGQTADGSIGYQANGANMSAINFVRVHGTETANIRVGAMYLTSSEMSEGSGTGDATDLAVVAVAILLAAMAASVTVYFGKKTR